MRPSKKPSSTALEKFSAEIGASFSNSSTSKLPSEVSKTTMGNLSFGDALAAREIGVRGYVSEASGDKRRPDPFSLARPVFQRQPPAGFQVQGGLNNKSEQRGIPVPAGCQGAAGFVAESVLIEYRVVRRDVGRIADQRVEPASGERGEP